MTTLDDLESDIDDVRSSVSDLEDNIQKLNEDMNIWGLFNERMIPFVYQKTLNNLLNNMEKTSYIETVDCFKNLIKGSDTPYPLTIQKYGKNNNLRHRKILRCITFLKNSKEFLEAAKTASIDTKPIFYYYSISYLFTFLMESFVDFDDSKIKHHGLYLNSNGGVERIAFSYNQKGGFFERLVHTLSILNYPSSFSSFISDLDDKNHIVLREQKTDISISNGNSILLNKLLEHNFKIDYGKLKLNKHPAGIYYKYERTSVILKDFILIFLSSVIARYNPILWKNIYLGEKSNLIFHFEKSFNNVNDMIRFVNDIIVQAEKGTLFERIALVI